MAALVYLDANPFVYAFEGDPGREGPLRELFVALSRRSGAAVTSELVLAELLAPSTQAGVMPEHQRHAIYTELLIRNTFIDARPVTRDILLATVELRRSQRLRLPNAIHLATAVGAECRYILSKDRDFGPLPEGPTPLKPDSASVSLLLRVLS